MFISSILSYLQRKKNEHTVYIDQIPTEIVRQKQNGSTRKGIFFRLTLQQDKLGGGEELVLRAAVTTIGSVIFSLIKLMLFLDEREFISKR